MPLSSLPPHLIEHAGKKLCSECRQAFTATIQQSLSKAFREHVLEKHRPPDPPKKK